MSRVFSILLLLSLSNAVSLAQSKLVVRDLNGLDWEYDERYSMLDSNEYFNYSFSIAEVRELEENSQRFLNRCECYITGDTLNIFIHNLLAEAGVAVSIQLFDDSWKSFIQHYSDIQEFDGQYNRKYEAKRSSLLLNKPSYNASDLLIGAIDLTAKNLETLNRISMRFKGRFQCVIIAKDGR